MTARSGTGDSSIGSDRDDLLAVYADRSQIIEGVNNHAPWLRLYRRIVSRQCADIFSADQLLFDAGGGSGIFARTLVTRGNSVVLLDRTRPMLDVARAEADRCGIHHGLHIVQGDLTAVPLADQTVDGIVCTQVLNFCRDRPAVFAEFARVLKPRGHVLLDIDGAYRWAVVELLAGRPDNAAAIMQQETDLARAIVGAEYNFVQPALLVAELQAAGFKCAVSGLLNFAPLLHVMGDSADYLEGRLPATAEWSRSEAGVDILEALEASPAVRALPLEVAGWIQVVATLAPSS